MHRDNKHTDQLCFTRRISGIVMIFFLGCVSDRNSNLRFKSMQKVKTRAFNSLFGKFESNESFYKFKTSEC